MVTQSSVEQFLDDLASGHPTPGGGSAAAIMGAMGAAMVSMVCNLTIGKKGYATVETEMKDAWRRMQAEDRAAQAPKRPQPADAA